MRTSLVIIGAALLIVAVFVGIQGNALSTEGCVDSAIQITPGATLCQGTNSVIDGVQFGGVAVNQETTITTQAVNPIFTSQATLTVWYILGQGLTYRAATMLFCSGAACTPSQSLAVTNNPNSKSGSVPEPSFTAPSPSMSVNQVYDFKATLTDSSGASYLTYWALMYQSATGYSVSFKLTNSYNGSLISGAMIKILQSDESTIKAYQTTTSTGALSFTLPYGAYFYEVIASGFNSGSGINGSPVQFLAQNSPTFALTLTPQYVPAPSYVVQVQVVNNTNGLPSGYLPSGYKPLSGATVTIVYAGNGTAIHNLPAVVTNSTGHAYFKLVSGCLYGCTHTGLIQYAAQVQESAGVWQYNPTLSGPFYSSAGQIVTVTFSVAPKIVNCNSQNTCSTTTESNQNSLTTTGSAGSTTTGGTSTPSTPVPTSLTTLVAWALGAPGILLLIVGLVLPGSKRGRR